MRTVEPTSPLMFVLLVRAALAACLLVGLLASSAHAQDRRAPTLQLAGGWVGFPDDGTVNEWMIGGSARWHLSPRVGVGPEVVHISGTRHSHLMVTGNLTVDLLPPLAGGPRPINAFAVVGGGLFQTRQDFLVGRFTSNEGAFTAGGGARLAAGERVTFGLDARIGWELHVRVNGFIGLRFGR